VRTCAVSGWTAAITACIAFVAAVPGSAGAADDAKFCAPWTQRTVKSGLGSLENLEFDGDGGLLISASDHDAIERMTPDGKVTTLVPDVTSPGGQRVRGRTLFFNTGDSAQAGLLNQPSGTIERFDLDTGKRSTYASGLTMPNGLAILPNGDFVTSRDLGSGTGITRIPHDDPAHPQTNWAQLNDQNGMAVDPTGTWLYADQTFTMDSNVLRIRIANPSETAVVASLADGGPKGLDDLTIDRDGILYVAANLTGEVFRLDPASGRHCAIATGLQNPSSLKFGRGPGWAAGSLYVVGFDGLVRELTPPAKPAPPPPGRKPRLELSLRPRVAVAGRRTRFHLTTSRAGGGLRAHVRVRLGGRTVRTNRRGRAGLTVRFKRPGRRVARATRKGYVAATRTVRVRPRR
jgi:hypothetical protein